MQEVVKHATYIGCPLCVSHERKMQILVGTPFGELPLQRLTTQVRSITLNL